MSTEQKENTAKKQDSPLFQLDDQANEKKRRAALAGRCAEYRKCLQKRAPLEVARLGALSAEPFKCKDGAEKVGLQGEQFYQPYLISWPKVEIVRVDGADISLFEEVLWLHYLKRADGYPLAGRWVNLSEIGGLFYQQAFQSYTGDKLAAAWGDDLAGLAERCRNLQGWPVMGLADLAFEWRVLPRFSVCLCYRRPAESRPAWATILFDAASSHYVAADVAAIAGNDLARLIMHPGGM